MPDWVVKLSDEAVEAKRRHEIDACRWILKYDLESDTHRDLMLEQIEEFRLLTLSQFRRFMALQATAEEDLPPGYDEYTYLDSIRDGRNQ